MITDLNAPPTEPITLEAAKLFLRIDHADEDNLISNLIVSARTQIETLTRKTLITRAQRLTLQPPFKRVLYLNIGPLQSVGSVILDMADGTQDILPLEELKINLRATPATLQPKTMGLWGWHSRLDIQSITVDMQVGYGDTPDDVPMPLRQAMMLLIGQAYEHRSGTELPGIPMMVDALVMPYRSLKL